MNRFKFFFLTTVTFGLAVNAFAGDALSEFRTFLKAMEPKTKHAFETEDISFFKAISTDDFKIKEGKTVMNKAQAMAQLQQMFSTSSNMKCSFSSKGASVKGRTGSVRTTGKYAFDMQLPDGKTHKMTMVQQMAETYRKTPKGWMVCFIENLPGGVMKMDGKPFDPSKMGGPPPPQTMPTGRVKPKKIG